MVAQARKEQELATGIIMNETETSQDKAVSILLARALARGGGTALPSCRYRSWRLPHSLGRPL